MEKEKSIKVLNILITINNDRIKGYETASEATEEQALKTLFKRFIRTSQKCKQELAREVISVGGEEADGTKTSGKFFRVRMDVKAALTGKDRRAILNACKNGENEAKDTYDKVLKNDLEYLNSEQQSIVGNQKSLLNADRKHIKSLVNELELA